MVRPLDVAWSILKTDFHIGDMRTGGHMARPAKNPLIPHQPQQYAGKRYGLPAMRYEDRFADFQESDYQTSVPPRPNFPAPIDDTFGRYHRGGSVPRLQDDGSYVGTHLDQQLSEIFEEDFDDGVERIASVGAHENVHSLIDDEMGQWAKQQSNIEALKRQQQENIERLTQQYPSIKPGLAFDAEFGLPAPGSAHDVLVRAGLKPEPYGDEEYPETFTDMDVDEAGNAYSKLRSMGHEFGAYSLTPDSSSPTGFMAPEERFNRMGSRQYPAAEYFHPDPELRSDISELHVAGPSEDQVRYQQMLQEQQAAGDVNPQTSVQ